MVKERKETELLVFVKVKALAKYILEVCGKAAVKYRYSLLNPLITDTLDILRLLFEANEISLKDPHRLELIRQAKAKIKCVDYISSLAVSAECFTKKQGEVISRLIGDCSKYLLGYYNSASKALTI